MIILIISTNLSMHNILTGTSCPTAPYQKIFKMTWTFPDGRKYLFGENAITKCGGSPIGYQGFGCSGHQHQSRSMQFTLWDDLICYMIENFRRASQDARVPFDSKCKYLTIKYWNAPSFILVTSTIGACENINPVCEFVKLERKGG